MYSAGTSHIKLATLNSFGKVFPRDGSIDKLNLQVLWIQRRMTLMKKGVIHGMSFKSTRPHCSHYSFRFSTKRTVEPVCSNLHYHQFPICCIDYFLSMAVLLFVCRKKTYLSFSLKVFGVTRKIGILVIHIKSTVQFIIYKKLSLLIVCTTYEQCENISYFCSSKFPKKLIKN